MSSPQAHRGLPLKDNVPSPGADMTLSWAPLLFPSALLPFLFLPPALFSLSSSSLKNYFPFISGFAGSHRCLGFPLAVVQRLLITVAAFVSERGLQYLWLPGPRAQAQS